MKLLALVPARGGSKGIKGKNIALLGGKPLIAWTIEAARGARSVSRVLVSTDSPEIADVARQAGVEVPFMRPAEISDDAAPALPVIRHAVRWLEEAEGWSAEAVAYLQPTSPFRTARDIDAAARIMRDSGADTVVSVVRVPHNMTPAAQMVERDGWLDFTVPESERQFRRQAKKSAFARNGPAVLIVSRVTLEAGRLYGPRIAAYEMPRLTSLDIDEAEDLSMAEALIPLVEKRNAEV